MSLVEVGPHRLLQGDLTTGCLALLMGEDRADVIYSDPPWGPGNQQYWHTHNERGSAPRTNWPAFLAAFCAACAINRKPEAPVFVEMGLRWLDELDAAMEREGLPLRHRWDITYGPKSKPLPNALSLYGPLDCAVPLRERHGPRVTGVILEAVVRPGVLVLDPCTGKGMTARNTHRLGGRFRGLELNPRRLAITEAWLRKRVER